MVLGKMRGLFLADWKRRVSAVNHRAVAKQVYRESRTTAGYFLLLTLANLIALAGLLTNSAPAIIGAMLISPLMGPILSFGFGFITGDVEVLRFSVRKIGLSIGLTVVVAAAAAYLSPLQLATPEILSRTRPSLFDLLVAILAGTAGAGALCTKRSILTIVPGVAIATAVIPPLSVCGYGLGTRQWSILWGGFFLFFTNFVAITLATCAVFFAFGFRPGEGTVTSPRTLRNRMLALLVLLAIISVPLVLTLRDSVVEMRDRRAIRASLENSFGQATLSNLSHRALADGTVSVEAILNTVEYRSVEEVSKAEAALAKALGHPATLYLEQVKMLRGGVIPSAAPLVRVRTPGETLSDANRDANEVLVQIVPLVSEMLAPATLEDASIVFEKGPHAPTIRLLVRRDIPLAAEEHKFLERYIQEHLQQPVVLKADLTPMVEPLLFERSQVSLSEDHQARLREAGRLFAAGAGPRVSLRSVPESRGRGALAAGRLVAARAYLESSCGIPSDRIAGTVAPPDPSGPRLILTFEREEEGPR